MTTECSREEDVLTAVCTGRWPARADAELRAHVEHCEICQDVAIVVASFAEELSDAEGSALGGRLAATAPVPDASTVWLRAQIQAHADAVRTAERPITVAHAVAFAAVVGVLGAVLGASSSWLQAGLQLTAHAFMQIDPRALSVPSAVASLLAEHAGLAALGGLAVMLTPVAVYWALREH
jgi:hypothetical protein